MPTPTSTMLNRNGMRQPQARNCSSGSRENTRTRAVDEQQPRRGAHLRPAPVEAALAGGRMLHRHQHRAAPLTAQAEALRSRSTTSSDRGPRPICS